MYILTNEEMRAADQYTIDALGVPSLLLMERAGIALADEAEKFESQGKIVCVCGGGNNGGDGFVCARILKERGRDASVVFYAEKTSVDCRLNMEKWLLSGGEILREIPDGAALIVDCLYGTGFHGSLLNADMDTVNRMNFLKEQGVNVLSADIPSGINGENGEVDGVAVEADVTLCIGEIKLGALFGEGIDRAGKIKRADIGIILPTKEYALLTERNSMKALLPKRKRNSHKGTYGKGAIVGGSIEYTGAPYLAASACLRAGAGYTVLFTPSAILPHYILKTPELLLKSTNEGGRYVFNEERMQELLFYDSIAYGMGMGVSEEVAKGALYLIERYEGKLILDADGLNSIAAYERGEFFNVWQRKKCDVLLTPHKKEFSRISGMKMEKISLNAVKKFAKDRKVNVLLKNAVSLVTDGERCAVNTSGCSGQAKGGSGDALAGVIAGLCAMGLSAYDGGVLGAYLCGKAAEFATQDIGEYSLTASDLIAYLGRAFLFVTKDVDEQGGEE